MADLILGSDRCYTLITTLVRKPKGQCRLVQIELHLPSSDVRLRFLDLDSFNRFHMALTDLACEIQAPDPLTYRDVVSRVYSDGDEVADSPLGPMEQSLLGEALRSHTY